MLSNWSNLHLEQERIGAGWAETVLAVLEAVLSEHSDNLAPE